MPYSYLSPCGGITSRGHPPLLCPCTCQGTPLPVQVLTPAHPPLLTCLSALIFLYLPEDALMPAKVQPYLTCPALPWLPRYTYPSSPSAPRPHGIPSYPTCLGSPIPVLPHLPRYPHRPPAQVLSYLPRCLCTSPALLLSYLLEFPHLPCASPPSPPSSSRKRGNPAG